MPTWQAHALGVSINAAVGGLSAGIGRTLKGESFWDGFRAGVPGGAVQYAGKVLGSRRFAGAGFAGRQVAALGGSMVHNAARGEGLLDRAVLPVGPARVYVDRGSPENSRVTLDLLTVAGAAYALANGARFNAQSSLSSGAMIMVLPDEFDTWTQPAAAFAGVIMHREGLRNRSQYSEILAHEGVHVMQHDFGQTVWSEPAERWLAHRVGGIAAPISRYVDLGLYKAVQRPITYYLVPARYNPWEQEASFLGRH